MIALFIILAVAGFIVATLSFAGIIISAINQLSWGVIAGFLGIFLGVGMIVSGIDGTNDISRQQCEEAGFEWITGTCYGTNVNINQGK